MNNFYIFRFIYEKENDTGDKYPCSCTVIFCPGDSIDINILQTEIKLFYEKYHYTDEIIAIGGNNIISYLKETFIDNVEEAFKYLFKVDRDYIGENLYISSYDNNGNLTSINNKEIDDSLIPFFTNQGLQNIFISRGGLVESKGAHHFVFPSGKHCNKFLRTGNILLHSSEIYFIAFCLLKFYKEEHTQIYCDTSSINTIAFALVDLKRKLFTGGAFKPIPIESFSSYSGLQDSRNRYFSNSLILISASTSGNILDKIKKANKLAKKENMIILFFLGKELAYIENEGNILCNLTQSENNKDGIKYYQTFDSSNCEHCIAGSYPVNVVGDVFLLEKPRINYITLSVKDSPKDLAKFVTEFNSKGSHDESIFKVSYKEKEKEINKKYEVYFDFYKVLKNLNRYSSFSKKLNHYIEQYIPNKTKYIIYLNDEASKLLADIVFDKIKINCKEENLPILISQDELVRINPDDIGVAVIIASCISNGKNLLYISRSLRMNDNLRIVYFIALTRTKNETQLNFLKSNLKQGVYGNETNIFVNVYNFFMLNESIDTTWVKEVEFLKKLKVLQDQIDEGKKEVLTFLSQRIELIEESMSDDKKGLSSNLFYPNLIRDEELELRKNFAFSNTYPLSQADIYFVMSSIINSLRNSLDLSRCLIQTEYVRNIIEPGNFNRFNDGAIQASILRISTRQELAYNLDYDLSKNMYDILFTMIKNYQTYQGEGLFEFIYALATQKMTLLSEHLLDICKLIKETISNDIYNLLIIYIEKEVLKIE